LKRTNHLVSIVAVSAMAWTTTANADPDYESATGIYNSVMSMMQSYCTNYYPENYWSCRADFLMGHSNTYAYVAQDFYANNQIDEGDTFALVSDWLWNSIYS
jgi:hypothetical protein